jgi:hypothetical protein
MEKTKAYVQKPVITPLTLIILVLNLAIDVAQSQSWYEGLGKILLTVGLLLSGAKVSDVKQLMMRLKSILQNKELNLAQKFEQIFNVVITGSATLGIIQEEMNMYPNEYFIKKKVPEVIEE